MLIRILEKLDQEIQVKIRNNPKILIDFINKESFHRPRRTYQRTYSKCRRSVSSSP